MRCRCIPDRQGLCRPVYRRPAVGPRCPLGLPAGTRTPQSPVPNVTHRLRPARVVLGCLERTEGIEPSSSAWKAEVLPLHHVRSVFVLARTEGIEPPSPGPGPGVLPLDYVRPFVAWVILPEKLRARASVLSPWRGVWTLTRALLGALWVMSPDLYPAGMTPAGRHAAATPDSGWRCAMGFCCRICWVMEVCLVPF